MKQYLYSLVKEERIQKRFNKRILLNPTGCWEWKGYLTNGYGTFIIKHKIFYAHRIGWMIKNKIDWPVDLQARHLCNNSRCVNPDHIVPGTAKENSLDRQLAGTHPKGNIHPLIKLSEKDSEGLFEQYKSIPHGYKLDFIKQQASKYNVSFSLIDKICRGELRTYQH